MTSKLCYGTGKLGFPGLLLSRAMSISVTLSELKSWLYTDDRILITCAGDGQVLHARILVCGVKTRVGNPVLPLYAIAIDPRDLNVFAVVGSDQGNSVYLFTQDMGLGNKPVPYSPSSTCSEANGKANPQVYKGHGKKRIWMV
ncbi:hypothetical protein V6N13_063851 [Hibiscus sabdariffa]